MFRVAATTRLVVAGSLAGLACCTVLSAASEARPECRPDDPLGLVATLPASADAVIVIEAGARQRASAAGRSLGSFVDESGLLKETTAAWSSLARSLQLSPQEAFDATLGERTIIIIDGLFDQCTDNKPRPARWALISHVCPNTEARLREALRPAPRAIEAGRPILAVENGAYELATSPAGRRSPTDPGAVILLAPASDSALFDSLLPALAGKPEGPTLSQCPSWAHALKLGGGDVLAYIRRPGAAPGQDDFLVCSARLTADGWSARFTASAGLLWDGSTLGGLPDTRPLAGLASLADRSMAVYCGPLTGISDRDRTDPLALGLPMSQRVTPELAQLLGPTIVAALHDGEKGSTPGEGTISLSLAVQTCDVPAAAALGDRLLARLISRRAAPAQASAQATIEPVAATSRARESAPPPAAPNSLNFEHLRPADARVIELTDTSGFTETGHMYLSWSFVAVPDAAQPGASQTAGWWLINLLQGSDDGRPCEEGARQALSRIERAATTEAKAPAPDACALLSRAVIHPDRLARALGPGLPPNCAGFVGSLRWIDSVEWKVSRADAGLIAGSFCVRMKPDPAP